MNMTGSNTRHIPAFDAIFDKYILIKHLLFFEQRCIDVNAVLRSHTLLLNLFSPYPKKVNTENVVPVLSLSLVSSSAVIEKSCLFSSHLPENPLKLEQVHQECLKQA